MKQQNYVGKGKVGFALYFLGGIALVWATTEGYLAEKFWLPLLVVFALLFTIVARKPRTPMAFLELLGLGIFDPEDEREVAVKHQAGFQAFVITQVLLMVATIVRYFQVPGNSILDIFLQDSLFTLMFSLVVVTQLVYIVSLRRNTEVTRV